MTAATSKMRCSDLKTERSQALSCCWVIFHGEGPVGSMAPIREKLLCSWHSSPFPSCLYGSRNLKAWYLIVQSLAGSHPQHGLFPHQPQLLHWVSVGSSYSWALLCASHHVGLASSSWVGSAFYSCEPHLHMPQTPEPPYDVWQTDHWDSSSHPGFFLCFLVVPEQSTEDRIYLLDQRT